MKHGCWDAQHLRWNLAAIALLTAACSGNIGASMTGGASTGGGGGSAGTAGGSGGSAGSAGSAGSGGNGGSAGSAGDAGGAGGGTTTCTPAEEIIAPRRLLRLTFNQIGTAVRDLLGAEASQMIVDKYQIGDLSQRSFPPLLSPREGSVISDAQFQKSDGIASTAAQYVFDHFDTVTKCGATPSEACAKSFTVAFAQRAYRRALDDREKTSLAQVYSESIAAGGTIKEAVQYSVYAALASPEFLYRTELGASATASGEVALTSLERASQLAFFLSDGPPDQILLDAAGKGELATVAQIDAQATRLLATDTAKQNMEAAMLAYFSIGNLDNVVIDSAKFPDWNVGLKNAMFTESEEFLKAGLWGGQIEDLLTSRKTRVNANLAKIYGISFPPAGAVLDANGFAPVELPAERAGLLTQAGFLAARARPDTDSVVGRGLLVNASILCATNPPFPSELAAKIAAANASLSGASEREKSNYRTMTQPCSGCHANFDPYGLVLESFDAIGVRRTVDSEQRAIDPSATLPETAGGKKVKDAAEMASVLAGNGAFVSCMTRNLLQYALASGPVELDSCAVSAVTKKFQADPDQSFGNLLKQIAVSRALSVRAGGAQ